MELGNYKTGNHKIKCPKCSHLRKNKSDTPLSLTVDSEGYIWNCHHCGYSGGKRNGYVKKEYKKPEAIQRIGLSGSIVRFFAERGISQGTLEEMGIKEKNGAIAFEYLKNNEVVNIKYRTLDKRFMQEKDCEPVYYNIDSVSDVVIHVEGEIDALSLIEVGYRSVISVPAGAPNTEVAENSSKMDFITNSGEQLEKAAKHILAFDNDKNGRILTDEVAKRIGKNKCWLVDFDDCKDANEYLVKYGKAALRSVIESAKEFPVEGIINFDKLQADLLKDLIENGHKGIYSTGWNSVDKLYKVREQEVTIITGRPNNGKSLWLDNLLVNLAQQYGHRFMVCSLENPQTKHFLGLLEKIARRAKWYDADSKDFLSAIKASDYEFLSNHFFLYQTEGNDLTIDAILQKAREMVLRRDIKGLVIDPHNQLEHKRPQSMTEHEYIGDVIRKVREFAKSTGCHVWYVAHPRKVTPDQVVTGYDISGSANWVNMADNLIVVERKKEANGEPTKMTQILVQKIRFQPEVGRQGIVELEFLPKEVRYYEANS